MLYLGVSHRRIFLLLWIAISRSGPPLECLSIGVIQAERVEGVGKQGDTERGREEGERDSPHQLWKRPDNLKISASSPLASLWEFPMWLWQWQGEKHLGCSVCSLSNQANSRRFRQMHNRAALTAGALSAWCDCTLFCAPTFGTWPESGLLVFCRSLRFCIFRFSIKNSSSFPSHLILLALIVDGTIIWRGRERTESGSD